MVPLPYWRAKRLLRFAHDDWEAFEAEATWEGVDLRALGADRLLGVIWYWLQRRTLREEGRQAWDALRTWIDTPDTTAGATDPNAPSPEEAVALATWKARRGRG